MSLGPIISKKADALKGTRCPRCHQGLLEIRIVEHDPVAGNQLGLVCSIRNPCTYSRKIV